MEARRMRRKQVYIQPNKFSFDHLVFDRFFLLYWLTKKCPDTFNGSNIL